MYDVYILRCSDDSLYDGRMTNVDARMRAHNKGRGAAYTFKRRPVQLVYVEPRKTRTTAILGDTSRVGRRSHLAIVVSGSDWCQQV